MKKVLGKIHGFTNVIEHAAVFVEAVVAGFKAYADKMNEYHAKQQPEKEGE